MTITYQSLSSGSIDDPSSYEGQRWIVLCQLECKNGTPETTIYDDGKKNSNPLLADNPTIGVGFNLRTSSNLLAVMAAYFNNTFFDTAASATHTQDQQLETQLIAIMKESWAGGTNVAARSSQVVSAINSYYAAITPAGSGQQPKTISAFSLTQAQIKTAFTTIVQKYESIVQGYDDIPLSNERITLLSFAWNETGLPLSKTALLGNGLLSALNNDDRAEAWFQIRYNSNGGSDNSVKPGIAKRRYFESQLFGLYNETVGSAIPLDEALQTYEMMSGSTKGVSNRSIMFTYEANYDSEVQAADTTYGGATGVLAQTLEQALQPAATTLIGQYVLDASINPYANQSLYSTSSFDPRDIQIAAQSGGSDLVDTARSGDSLNTGSIQSSLLIALNGNDTLSAVGSTGDALIGGTGNDIINAGSGDYIVAGTGSDVITLSTGADTVVLGESDSVSDAGQDTVYAQQDTSAVSYYVGTGTHETIYLGNNKSSNINLVSKSTGAITPLSINGIWVATNVWYDTSTQSTVIQSTQDGATTLSIYSADGSTSSAQQSDAVQATLMSDAINAANNSEGLLTNEATVSVTGSSVSMLTSNDSSAQPDESESGLDQEYAGDGSGDADLTLYNFTGPSEDGITLQSAPSISTPTLQSSNLSSLDTSLPGGAYSPNYYGDDGLNGSALVSNIYGSNTTGSSGNIIDGFGNASFISAGNGNNLVDADGLDLNDPGQSIVDGPNPNLYILGGTGDQYIFGETSGNETIQGGNLGSDTTAEVVIDGEGSNASITLGTEDGIVLGGTGTDTLNAGNAQIQNTSGVVGSVDAWIFAGVDFGKIPSNATFSAPGWSGNGNFQIDINGNAYLGSSLDSGAAGSSTLPGSLIIGGTGNNFLIGNSGNDTIIGGTESVVGAYDTAPGAFSMDADNVYVGGAGSNLIIAGDGTDLIFADMPTTVSNWANLDSTDSDTVYGGNGGEDIVYGSGGNDYFYGGAGAFQVYTGNGNSSVFAGSGLTTVIGGTGSDFIEGGSGQDELAGGSVSDSIFGNDTIFGGSGNSTIFGMGGGDYINGGGGNDWIFADIDPTDNADWADAGNNSSVTIDGGGGNDTIYGSGGTNLIYANSGNDVINLGNGATTLDGGAGSDSIVAGNGSETYTLYDNGEQDTISSGSNAASLALNLSGFDEDDITFSNDGAGDLVISFGSSSVEIVGYIAGGESNVTLDLDDGTLGASDIAYALQQPGGNVEWGSNGSADTITASDGNETIGNLTGDNDLQGGSGYDTIYGGTGADTIEAGTGGANIVGGTGTETYVFNTGDGSEVINENQSSAGSDTLEFGSSVGKWDISFTQQGANLVMLVDGGANGSVEIVNYFAATSGSAHTVDSIQFSDGTTMNQATVTSALVYNNAKITGTSGSNIYSFDAFSGTNFISQTNASSSNTINFTDGIVSSFIVARRDMFNDLVLTDTLDGVSVTVDNYFVDNNGGIGNNFTVNFSDGTSWDSQQILTATMTPSGGPDTLWGSDGNDSITAGQGNTLIIATTGNNTLTGGAGADTLEGGSGADTLIAGMGSTTLIGGSGDEVLVAGTGSDLLEAGTGSTTYVLDAGFGQAQIQPGSGAGVVQFGTGISASDLTLGLTTDSNGNPALLIQDGSSNVTIEGGLSGRINQFEFADGTQLTLAGLLANATVEAGSIAGANGDSIINTSTAASLSVAGNDTLLGTGASDTLTAGIGTESLLASGDNASVIGGSGNETLIGAGTGDTVVAGSGSQELYGLGTADVLVGGIGDDTLYGGAGSDELVAGTGNTVMYGGGGADSIVLTAGSTVTFSPSSTSTTELIELPVGMTLADFTAEEGTNGDLILQSISGNTTAIVNGYFSGSSGALWMIADSTGAAEPLSQWLASFQIQPPSGYEQEIADLQQGFAANLTATLSQIGQKGGDLSAPSSSFTQGPGNEYQFNGITTQNVTAQGGTANLGNSDNEQTTFTVMQTGSTSYTVTTPTYGEVTIPGWEEFVPDSSLTSLQIETMDNESGVGNPYGLSIQATTDAGVQGFEVTQLPTTENVQTGTASTVETVPVYTDTYQETQSFTVYNVTGDGGNDVITAGAGSSSNNYNGNGVSTSTSDTGFVGTVITGNGNVSVNLGLSNVAGGPTQPEYYPRDSLPLGAFIEAGSGNDSIVGSGGADVIAAGTGFDQILANMGSTVYVPLEGDSTEYIYIQGAYYGGAPLPQSTLVLPNGITPQDLQYRLITDAPTPSTTEPGLLSTGEELQITYGNSSVLLPFGFNDAALYPAPSNGDEDGIDRFEFSDGEVLSRSQLIAMAGAPVSISDFNPEVTPEISSVSAGTTVQGGSLFNGSDSSGLPVTWYQVANTGTNGGYFELNGVAQTPGQAFDVSASQLPELTYVAGTAGIDSIQVSAFDGVTWGSTTSFNVGASFYGATYGATEVDQKVVGGSTGPDTLVGGYDGDTLVGSSGQDTFQYSPGGGAEIISESVATNSTSANVLEFGAGITPSSLTLSIASDGALVISTGGVGDSVSIEGFNPLNPVQSLPIQSFQFSDGTTLTLAQLLSDSAVTGMSGSIDNLDGSVTSYSFTPSQQQTYYAYTVDSSGNYIADAYVYENGGQITDSYINNADGSYIDTELWTPWGGASTTSILTYDANNDLVSEQDTYPDGSSGAYTYNDAGQTLTAEVTNTDGSSSDSTYVYNADGTYTETTLEYSATKQLVGKLITNPDGSTDAYTYGAQGQLLTADVTSANGVTSDSTYVYNADGSTSVSDTIVGNSNNETLTGAANADLLEAGTGNQLLVGGSGNETYAFGIGFGQDTIEANTAGASNTIQFLSDITSSDVTFSSDGTNVTITVTGSTGADGQPSSITLPNHYVNGQPVNDIDQIVFGDGTTVSMAQINELLSVSGGSPVQYQPETVLTAPSTGNSTLTSDNGNDTLIGSDGNGLTSMVGGSGSDVMIAGLGYTLMQGGTGTETYEIGPGGNASPSGTSGGQTTIVLNATESGINTLAFMGDISLSDLIFVKGETGLEMVASDGTSTEEVQVTNYFTMNGQPTGGLQGITFANGDTVSLATLDADLAAYNGIQMTPDGGFIKATSQWEEAANVTVSGGVNTITAQTETTMMGGTGSDLFDLAGNDNVTLGSGSDTVDTLSGDSGDVLQFGSGTALINAGNAAELYQVQTTSGNATIIGSGSSTLHYGAGIVSQDIVAQQQGNDLLLTDTVGGHSLDFSGWFSNTTNELSSIDFADGSSWTPASSSLTSLFNEDLHASTGNESLVGTAGNDTLNSDNGTDTLVGGTGETTLAGGSGADTLVAGTGSNVMDGGSGTETYQFGEGFGATTVDMAASEQGVNTIQFLSGIDASQLSYTQSGSSLVIKVPEANGDTGTITIANHFVNGSSANGNIDELTFTNGTVLIADGTVLTAPPSGNDTLTSDNGNDVLIGSEGNGFTSMIGGSGSDVMVAGLGYTAMRGGTGTETYEIGPGGGASSSPTSGGQTTIVTNATESGANTLAFVGDIGLSDLTFARAGSNLEMVASDATSAEQVQVVNYFTSNGQPSGNIQGITIANGDTVSLAMVNAYFAAGWGAMQMMPDGGAIRTTGLWESPSASVTVSGGVNTITAQTEATMMGGTGSDLFDLAGNDNVTLGSGSDTVDTLSGDSGDVLQFGSGTALINAGNAAELYQVQTTSGNATIIGSGSSTLHYGAGIVSQDIVVQQQGNDLILTDTLNGGSLDFSDWFSNTTNELSGIDFVDGSSWTPASSSATSLFNENLYASKDNESLAGTGSNDTLNSDNGTDTLVGGSGTTTLIGGTGTDLLVAGTGSSVMEGGSGTETYQFGEGFGETTIDVASTEQDANTIQFLAGIDASQLSYAQSGSNLVITVAEANGGTGTITVANHFVNGAPISSDISELTFADGSSVTMAQINQPLSSGSSNNAESLANSEIPQAAAKVQGSKTQSSDSVTSKSEHPAKAVASSGTPKMVSQTSGSIGNFASIHGKKEAEAHAGLPSVIPNSSADGADGNLQSSSSNGAATPYASPTSGQTTPSTGLNGLALNNTALVLWDSDSHVDAGAPNDPVEGDPNDANSWETLGAKGASQQLGTAPRDTGRNWGQAPASSSKGRWLNRTASAANDMIKALSAQGSVQTLNGQEKNKGERIQLQDGTLWSLSSLDRTMAALSSNAQPGTAHASRGPSAFGSADLAHAQLVEAMASFSPQASAESGLVPTASEAYAIALAAQVH